MCKVDFDAGSKEDDGAIEEVSMEIDGQSNSSQNGSVAMDVSMQGDVDMECDDDNANNASNTSLTLPPLRGVAVRSVAGDLLLVRLRDGGMKVLRCRLVPEDVLARSVIDVLCRALPKGTAALDFLVDFAETSVWLPQASEWDRLGSLLRTLAFGEKLPHTSAVPSLRDPEPWDQLVSSSLHLKLLNSLPEAVRAKLMARSPFKSFPEQWSALPFVCRTSTETFRACLRVVLSRLHLVYEGSKTDTKSYSDGDLLRPLLLVLACAAGAKQYAAYYLHDDASLALLGARLENDQVEAGNGFALDRPFHLFRWMMAVAQFQSTSFDLPSWWCGRVPDAEVLEAAELLPLRRVMELWLLRCGSAADKDRVIRAVSVRRLKESGPPAVPKLGGCVLFSSNVAKMSVRWSGDAVAGNRVGEKDFVVALENARGSADELVACYLGFEFVNLSGWSLTRLPLGVMVAVMQSLQRVVDRPDAGWPAALYDVMGRTDVGLQRLHALGKDDVELAKKVSWGDPELRESERQAGVLLTHPVSYLRFREDRRLQEAQRLLGTWSRVNISVPQAAGMSDHDYIAEQQKQALIHAVRMGARCIGRGMLSLGSDEFSANLAAGERENWELFVPPMPRSIRVVETRSSVAVDDSGSNAGVLDWQEFHSGVAAGLRVSANGAITINNAWIVFNRPPDGSPNARIFAHGGLLLGLGLNGHLAKLSFARLYDYLARANVMISIGLLLGISATMMGTMDTAITKLLSVHLPMLHPPTSADLEVPPALEVVSMIGLGLLYKETCHRRMAETLIAEIDRQPTEDKAFLRESHSLAAGLALGWIMLGQGGNDAVGLDDMGLENRLLRFIVGGGRTVGAADFVHQMGVSGAADGVAYTESNHHQRSNLVRPGTHVNVNLTAVPSMYALALMYLKTNNRDVANRLRPPETLFLLNYVRPDFLMHRCLCRALVLWSSVQSTDEWLMQQIPGPVWKYGDPDKGAALLAEEMADELPEGRNFNLVMQSRCYCIAGSLLALGISRAGLQDLAARDMILRWIRSFMGLRKSFGERDIGVLETCLDAMCLAGAICMAGSGDLELMRITRALMLRTSVSYGTRMAEAMALGFLFLGGARYTLSTSNTAVAALLTSVFPIFPKMPSENLYHLQALRHMWVLAAEERSVVVLDAVTHKPLAATLHFGGQQFAAPCIVPLHVEDIVASHDGYHSARIKHPFSLPLKIFLQPQQDASLETYRLATSLDVSAQKRFFSSLFVERSCSRLASSLALLQRLPRVSLPQNCASLFLSDFCASLVAEHASLLRGYMHSSSGSWSSLSIEDAHRLAFVVAVACIPPQGEASNESDDVENPLILAVQMKGLIPFNVCEQISHVMSKK